jgi:hypothetical protein
MDHDKFVEKPRRQPNNSMQRTALRAAADAECRLIRVNCKP